MPPRVKTYLKDKYPEIAEYLVDTHTRNTIAPKANRLVELSCPQCDHQWAAKLGNITTRFEKTGVVRCPAWTEREAAHANKIYRIYDAGKRRWVRDINSPAYKS